MKNVFAAILVLVFMGCATMSPMEKRREGLMSCMKEIKGFDDGKLNEAFEVCRQMYGMRKVD